MSEFQYKKYLFKLRKSILLGESDDTQYKLLRYVNSYGNKILSLGEYIQDTKNKYILSETKKRINLINGVYAKCIELKGTYTEKEYQKLYRELHKIHNISNSLHVTFCNTKEYNFLRNLKEGNIHGICFCCGNITFFTELHHIFGKKNNGFTLSICVPCHYKYKGKNHCINIGNKIEKML